MAKLDDSNNTQQGFLTAVINAYSLKCESEQQKGGFAAARKAQKGTEKVHQKTRVLTYHAPESNL